MKLLFLDIDGVLNDHTAMPNGYSQINPKCLNNLCKILKKCPDVKIVISSAWRYMMLDETPSINERGFEYIFCLFGADYDLINRRILGRTISDEDICIKLGILESGANLDNEWLQENGCLLRREQILHFVKDEKFIVLDDLNLEMPELILTDGKVGLTNELANLVIQKLIF